MVLLGIRQYVVSSRFWGISAMAAEKPTAAAVAKTTVLLYTDTRNPMYTGKGGIDE